MTAVFAHGVLKESQSLPLSPEAQKVLEPHLKDAKLDQRFVYYLLAAKGICVVPLSSGFNSDRYGFRFTLLEADDAKFDETVDNLCAAVREYCNS
jgi:aspartate/methionine/tyrosine aminotransferase